MATYEEVLDKLAEGNDYGIQDGDLVQVREGVGLVNDDNWLDLLVRC